METLDLKNESLKELKSDFDGVIDNLLKTAKSEEKQSKDNKELHESISQKVFRRLLVRNAELTLLSKINLDLLKLYGVSLKENNLSKEEKKAFINIKTSEKSADESVENKREYLTNEQLAYRFSVVDLFVEKALAYLEDRAEKFKKRGNSFFYIGFGFILLGLFISLIQLSILFFPTLPTLIFEKYEVYTTEPRWDIILLKFISSFTFYGFIVLVSVGFWKLGKAMIDQSERLYHNHHALREGRLYLHLVSHEVSIERIKDVFNWNESDNLNAFTSMDVNAKAPWGNILSDLVKTLPEIFKSKKAV